MCLIKRSLEWVSQTYTRLQKERKQYVSLNWLIVQPVCHVYDWMFYQKWGVFLWQSGGALHPLSHTVTPRRQCSPQPENNPRHTERLEVANHWHDLSFSLKWRVIQWNWPAGSSERHMLLLVRVSQLLIRLVCNNQQPIEEKHTDQMNYSISSWCPQTAVHSFCAACC